MACCLAPARVRCTVKARRHGTSLKAHIAYLSTWETWRRIHCQQAPLWAQERKLAGRLGVSWWHGPASSRPPCPAPRAFAAIDRLQALETESR